MANFLSAPSSFPKKEETLPKPGSVLPFMPIEGRTIILVIKFRQRARPFSYPCANDRISQILSSPILRVHVNLRGTCFPCIFCASAVLLLQSAVRPSTGSPRSRCFKERREPTLNLHLDIGGGC